MIILKRIIHNYTFSASGKSITFNEYSTILLSNVLVITNVTRGIIIYNFTQVAFGGSVTDNILTLTYNTSTMADSDQLQIFYDDSGDEAKIVDYESSTVFYTGSAQPGTLISVAKWKISKTILSSSGFVRTWADGNTNYDNVWDNRAALSYS